MSQELHFRLDPLFSDRKYSAYSEENEATLNLPVKGNVGIF